MLVAINAGNFNVDYYDGVAYTGAPTMREKCALAKDYGGIMIWELTLDAEGEYSLLAVIKQEMLPAVPEVPETTDGEGKKDEDYTLYVVIPVVCAVAVGGAAAVTVVILKKKKAK